MSQVNWDKTNDRDEQVVARAEEFVLSDAITHNLLRKILTQLKTMNMYLSHLDRDGDSITERETEETR